MNKNDMRYTAIRAVRGECRRIGAVITEKQALAFLDDLARTDPDLVASIWYANASENQIRLFKKEWNEQKMMQFLS